MSCPTHPAGWRAEARAGYVEQDVGPGQASGSATVTVPYPSVAAAYDNAGVSDDATPAEGNFDGGGYSFSAQALAAGGITPGGTVIQGGFSFTWPGAAPGQPDNITLSGQVVHVSAAGSQLRSTARARSAPRPAR